MAEPFEKSGWPQASLNDQQLELILRNLASLPTFPAVAARLIELTKRAADSPAQHAAAEQALELIRSDPSLAAWLLSAANRGERSSARTIEQAFKKVGLEAVRSAALTVRVFQDDPQGPVIDSGLDRPAFWRHCLAVAAGAEMIAEQAALPADKAEAFLCGLLHDLGKLALEQSFPKSYQRALEAAEAHKGNIAEYERKVIGVDHTVAGRRLAELWRLPEPLAEVIWLHHQPIETMPEGLSQPILVAVVALADTIAREQGLGFSGNYSVSGSSEQMAGRLGLSAEALGELADRLPETVRRRCDLLGLQQAADETSYHHAVAGAKDELARLNEELRHHAALLAAQAQAFRHLRDLSVRLRPEATVPEALLQIAKATAPARSCRPGPAEPVLAYSLGEAGDILILRWTGEERPSYRAAVVASLPTAPQPDGSPEPADRLLGQLSAGGCEVNDWLDASAYVHQPLLCGGRWIGGVLYPRLADETEEVAAALAATLALALAIVQQRGKAMRLSEQLAQASQALAETQEIRAEAKALSAIGEMASGAAHELNNPLAIVSGRAQLMQEKARTKEQRKTWQLIAEQAQRISDVITELMEFASPPKPQPQPLNVGEILTEAAKAFSSSDHPKAASARVDIQIGEDVPPVLADEAQTRAVIAELIANAATAAARAPWITLSAEADEINRTVILSVADDGPGMDQQTLANAFMPFFSSQPAGRRRGMGLPRARRLVENNRGRIWIRSRPNEGATVYVELPSARPSPGRREAQEQTDAGS